MHTDFVQSNSAKLVKSLIWADMGFRASLAVSEFVLANQSVLVDSHLKHGILSGLVINYGRPFGSNSGLTYLKEKLEGKMGVDALKVHESLLELRNRVYAHKDESNQSDPTPKDERVTLKFTPDGRLKSSAAGLTFQVDNIVIKHLNERVEDVRAMMKHELKSELKGKLTQFGDYWVEDNGYRFQNEN